MTYEEVLKKHGVTESIRGGVEDGWCGILDELFTDLKAMGWSGHLLQCKEKFASLRCYVDYNGIDNIDAAYTRVDIAESESLRICEWCGQPGYEKEISGWWKTLCDEHHKQREEFDKNAEWRRILNERAQKS